LGSNQLAFLQLVILPRGLIADWEAGTAFVAQITGCSLARLRELLAVEPT
jgi:hypothetical protein